MIQMLVEIFSFTFMVRAIVVGLLVSLCAALLGVNLVLKRYAMIGTGLSHVGFAAMAIAGVFDLAPLSLSMPVVVAAAFLLLRLNENNKIRGDSAVALVSTSSLAIGVIVVSMTTGLTLHICNVMFGSIFAMARADMYISVVLSVVVLGLFVLFYKQLFAVTYDEDFARATGTKVEVYKSLLAILTAITVVLGMRMMGALLIASLTIFPALTAMRLCKRFLSVVITAAVVGVVCFFIGMLFSFGLDLPPGASVVGVNLVVFAVFSVLAIIKRGGVRV
ncbi:MAG: metal ABC transporter permease [Treponema sp.]|jgi:zinc transport system permease protein|nr:metal ABC transporter permease [Treponema sp.]